MVYFRSARGLKFEAAVFRASQQSFALMQSKAPGAIAHQRKNLPKYLALKPSQKSAIRAILSPLILRI